MSQVHFIHSGFSFSFILIILFDSFGCPSELLLNMLSFVKCIFTQSSKVCNALLRQHANKFASTDNQTSDLSVNLKSIILHKKYSFRWDSLWSGIHLKYFVVSKKSIETRCWIFVFRHFLMFAYSLATFHQPIHITHTHTTTHSQCHSCSCMLVINCMREIESIKNKIWFFKGTH